ncbi:MAG TPA: hypothetical protein DEQ02_09595, partial [Ruminococcaceae bacterium]|nr:hypothetical protein [Oscillospiraceae bacterium]
MKVAVIPNFKKKGAHKACVAFCEFLNGIGVQPLIASKLPEQTQGVYMPAEDMLDVCDLAVAIGGDGTLIHAAKQAAL